MSPRNTPNTTVCGLLWLLEQPQMIVCHRRRAVRDRVLRKTWYGMVIIIISEEAVYTHP